MRGVLSFVAVSVILGIFGGVFYRFKSWTRDTE